MEIIRLMPYTRAYVARACMRADDMTEILAFYIARYGKPIPNSLKKGLTDALRRFDEYALAKYDRDGAVKLRDIIQIAHPTPRTAEQEQLWKRVLKRDLATPLTWETQLSANGNTRAVWERLIEENALGYMAMLRNLRNIVEADPHNIDQVYTALADSGRVRRSRVLPFRFYSAYRELKNHPRATSATLDALEKAIQAAAANIRQIPGRSLIAIDVSGSMGQAISQKSKVICRDIACLIGALANRICEDALIITFDTRARKYTFPRGAGILTTADSMACNGGGTNIHLPFEYLLQNRIAVDRVIMLSDNEINRGWCGRGYYGNGHPAQESAEACRRALNPRMWVHAVDLQGYGTQQFIGEGTNLVAGWSEKVLEFIALAEGGVDSLVKRIEQVEL